MARLGISVSIVLSGLAGVSALAAGQFLPKEQWAQVSYEPANGGIYFKANVAGRDVWAMVDTATANSAIDVELARGTGLRNVLVRIPGQYETRYPKLAAQDLGALSKAADRKIEFVLGQDFLKPLVLVVDPPRQVFHFVASGTFRMPPNTQQLQLKSLSPPQVEMKIDRKVAVVSVDTGFNGQLSLSPAALATFAPSGSAREIVFGGYEVRNIQIEQAAMPSGDGVVGMGILGKVRFALDISTGNLWVGAPLGHIDDDD